jgi:hypothetical protein
MGVGVIAITHSYDEGEMLGPCHLQEPPCLPRAPVLATAWRNVGKMYLSTPAV